MLNGGYGGARHGAVRLGRVWHGGYGKVQHGKVRLVMVSFGTAVVVWHGSVRRGKVRRGKVRFGTAGIERCENMQKCEWKVKGLYPVSADTAADVINSCQDESGYISAKSVVDVSRPEKAPLHGCFEWNNDAAAEMWREQQARVMIKNIVTVEIEDDKREVAKTFVHVISDDKSRGYKLTDVAIHNESDREYVLKTAKRELLAFQEKYRQLTELALVFAAIAEVV